MLEKYFYWKRMTQRPDKRGWFRNICAMSGGGWDGGGVASVWCLHVSRGPLTTDLTQTIGPIKDPGHWAQDTWPSSLTSATCTRWPLPHAAPLLTPWPPAGVVCPLLCRAQPGRAPAPGSSRIWRCHSRGDRRNPRRHLRRDVRWQPSVQLQLQGEAEL